MAWTLLASITGGGFTGSPVTVGPIDTSGADLLIVVTQNYNMIGGSNPTISDNKGNDWVHAVANEDNVSNLYLDFSVPVPVTGVGAGHTFTTSAIISTMQIMAFSGAIEDPLDQVQDFGQNSGTSIQAGSITPPNNCLIIAGICVGAGGGAEGFAINSGYTIAQAIDASSGSNLAGAAAYLIQTSAATTNPTWTYNHDAVTSAALASFRSSDVIVESVVLGAMVW